jgi:hypothetical protein
MEFWEVKGLCASYVLLGVPFAVPVVSWDQLYFESSLNTEPLRHELSSAAGTSGCVFESHSQGIDICLRLFCVYICR